PITALDGPPPPAGHPLLAALTRAAARALARLQHEIDSTEPGTSQPATSPPATSPPATSQPGTGQPGTGQSDPWQAAASPDDCRHHAATAGYRPTTAIRDYVTARDQTCRYPCCRQPAWHADLDHTRAWHRGGRTCPCNLGALCRTHHILKQLQGWTLTQPRPGTFQWTTPAGRTHTREPDIHPS
ncbi:MAG: HNH endonuclease signature motif containing protein, partial [Streptosporangiaceae bacterium]